MSLQQAGPAILTIGGAILGNFIAPGIGGLIGGMAGGLIGSLIFSRSQQPLIPDIGLMSSSYGRPIPIVYGTVRLPGTMIWQTDIQTKGHGIGKGIGGGGTYSYWQSAAIAFCAGEAQIIKLWLDGKLFLDSTAGYTGELVKHKFAIRWHDGSDSQLQDPLIKQWVADHVIPGEACPAYRGLAHLVMQQVDLINYGTRFPQVTGLVSTNATLTTRFVPLTRLDPAQSGDSAGAAGVAVDWTREIVYGVTNSFGTGIEAFDIVTGRCVTAKTLAQLFPLGGPGNTIRDVAVCQGGFVYLLSDDVFAPHYISTLDPASLAVIRTVAVANASYDWWFTHVTPFQVIGPLDVQDMLAWVDGNLGHLIIADPATGNATQCIPTLTGIAVGAVGCWPVIGNQDAVAGTTDVWLLNIGGIGDASGTLYIWKAVTGADPSAIVAMGNWNLVATLTPADMGFASADYTNSISGQYYATDDSLVISIGEGTFRTFKWSEATGVAWSTTGFNVPQNAYSINDRGFTGGAYNNTDLADGTVTASPTGFVFTTGGPFAFDSYRNAAIVRLGTDLNVAYMMRTVGVEYPVADIITDLCARVGVTADMIDVSAVTATTIGYVVADAKSAGAAILDLCHTFQIDMVESDYVLKFIPRGLAPAVTITQDELASLDANDPSKFWLPKSALEQEMPLQINLRYVDPAIDYQPGSTYAKRTALPVPTQFSKRIKTVDLPVVANTIEARAIAERWLYTMWAERETYELALSAKHLWLDPADNVTVTLDNGDSYTVRLSQQEIGADFSMKLSASAEDTTTYASPNTLGAVYGAVPQVVTANPFGDLLLFNVPLLEDSDSTGGVATRIYFAVGAYPGGWVAGSVFRSTDSATWTNFATVVQAPGWGHATTALGDTVSKFATDYVNTVTVALMDDGSIDLPVSVTRAELLNGANGALLGQELIQYQTATANGDGTFTLSKILRGRRGTEWATGLHAAGDVFVMLAADGTIQAKTLPLAEIGQTEQWKLVPSGRFVDQALTRNFAYLGYDLKPYAPVNFTRAPSGSDLVATWVRRTRIGGLFQEGTDTAPLSEESEAYEAYVLADAGALAAFDPTDAGTYVRKFAALSSATLTYTAAQMATDSFMPATDTLCLVVYQLSAIVGRGFQGYQALAAS